MAPTNIVRETPRKISPLTHKAEASIIDPLRAGPIASTLSESKHAKADSVPNRLPGLPAARRLSAREARRKARARDEPPRRARSLLSGRRRKRAKAHFLLSPPNLPVSAAPQHSTKFTASPPRLVSLYFDCMSAPVWRIVATTLSSADADRRRAARARPPRSP
jgi:hypothetical protein